MPSTITVSTPATTTYSSQFLESPITPHPKFKVGDQVVIKRNFDKSSWPGFNLEMEQILQRNGNCLTISKVEVSAYGICYRVRESQYYIWAEYWMEPAGPPKSKHEQLVEKINQLWTRQEYYKCLNSK